MSTASDCVTMQGLIALEQMHGEARDELKAAVKRWDAYQLDILRNRF